MIFQPEIDAFLGGLFGGGGDVAAAGYQAGDLPEAIPNVAPLVTRTAASLPSIATGAGDAAAAGSGFGAGTFAFSAAVAAQASDQPKAKPQGPRSPITPAPNPCSGSDKQIVRDASVNALPHLNPNQNETNNITPLNDDFAKVANPTAVNTQGWTQQFSLHGTGTESPIIPGQKTFAVKMYADPRLGSTIAVVYPTMSFMHFLQAPLFEAGVHVNARNARASMGCH
jgi:hypothetical protein